MGLREDIIQGVREWLKAGIGLSDDEVRPIDALFDEDLRPELSYMTVNVRGLRQIGFSEMALEDGASLTTTTRTERIALVSLNAYGPDAFEWLVAATLLADHWEANEALSDADLAFPLFSEIRDLSEFMDNAREERFQVDLEIGVSVDSEPVETPPAEHFLIEIELQKEPIDEDDPDALVVELDVPPS